MQIPPIGNTPPPHGVGDITPDQKKAQADIKDIQYLLEILQKLPASKAEDRKDVIMKIMKDVKELGDNIPPKCSKDMATLRSNLMDQLKEPGTQSISQHDLDNDMFLLGKLSGEIGS